METLLREEMAELRQVVAESREELAAHRHALNQCLEVKETVEVLVQEVQDRMQELEFSVAGVSDNTARHGKAISAIAEQQKRTSATLDAIVRAVKRLSRRRSRSREAKQGGCRTPVPVNRTPVPVHMPDTLPTSESQAAGTRTEVESCDDALGPEAASVPEDVLGFQMPVGAHADFGNDVQWHDWPMAAAELDTSPAFVSGRHESVRSSAKRRNCRSNRMAVERRPGTGGDEMRQSEEGVLARIEDALTRLDEGAGPRIQPASWANSPMTSASDVAPGRASAARSSSARRERRAQRCQPA